MRRTRAVLVEPSIHQFQILGAGGAHARDEFKAPAGAVQQEQGPLPCWDVESLWPDERSIAYGVCSWLVLPGLVPDALAHIRGHAQSVDAKLPHASDSAWPIGQDEMAKRVREHH